MRGSRSRIRTRPWKRSQPGFEGRSDPAEDRQHPARNDPASLDAGPHRRAESALTEPGPPTQLADDRRTAWLPEGLTFADAQPPRATGPEDGTLPATSNAGPRWVEIGSPKSTSAPSELTEQQLPSAAVESSARPEASVWLPAELESQLASSTAFHEARPQAEIAATSVAASRHDPESPPATRTGDGLTKDVASQWSFFMVEEREPQPEDPDRPTESDEIARPEPRPDVQAAGAATWLGEVLDDQSHLAQHEASWTEIPSEQDDTNVVQYPHALVQEHSSIDDSQPTADLETSNIVAALATYDQRRKAVESYCRELSPSEEGANVARYTLSVLDVNNGADEALLMATRVFAAEGLTTSEVDGKRESQRVANHQDPCASTVGMLAARENGSLSSNEYARLERHLDDCLVCRAAELRAERADRAFAAILELTLIPGKRGWGA